MIIFAIPQEFQDILRNLFPDVDEGNEEHEGYWCIQINPIVCQCGRKTDFVEPKEYHLVVVWEEKDDEEILRIAARAKRLGYNPKIVEYEVDYGPSIEFYEAEREGLFGGERVNR